MVKAPPKLTKLLKTIITAGLVVFILKKIGLTNIIEVFALTGWRIFLVGFLFYVIASLFNTILLKKLVLWSSGKKINMMSVFLDASRSSAFASLTPSGAGHLLLINLLISRGLDKGSAAAIFFSYKVLNYAVVFFLAFMGTVFIMKDLVYSVTIMTMLIILSIIMLLLLYEKPKGIFKKLVSEKIRNKFSGFSSSIKSVFKDGYWKICIAISLKFLCVLFLSSVVFLIMKSRGISVFFIEILLLMNIAELISRVPLTMGGFGVREGSAVFLFSTIGIAADVTVAAYLFYYVIMYSSIALSLIFLTRRYGT